MDKLRKRTPFTTREEESIDEDRFVLDEEEQEEVVNNIRRDVHQSNERFRVILQTFLALSALIQTAAFFAPSAFIVDRRTTSARTLVLVNIIVHLGNALPLFPALHSWSHQHISESSWILQKRTLWTSVISTVAPVMSVLSGDNWLQTAWWSITLLLNLVIRLGIQWINEGERSIDELEGLKYDAKGA